LDVRIEKRLQARRHVQATERRRQRNLQYAAWLFTVDGSEVFRILDGRQHGADSFEEALPHLGRREAPGGSLQEADSETLLEACESLRNHGRRGVQLAGRGGQAP